MRCICYIHEDRGCHCLLLDHLHDRSLTMASCTRFGNGNQARDQCMHNELKKSISAQIGKIRQTSGSHFPSVLTLLSNIKGLQINIDACFLSNPYATDLFMEYLTKELIDTGQLKKVIEYYPTQNRQLAEVLAPLLQVPAENILLGNGATEIIQALLQRFARKKVLVNLPTFSPYYEFVTPDTEVIFHRLQKDEDFRLAKDAFLQQVSTHRPDTIVLINPNNPDGSYLPQAELRALLAKLHDIPQIILDESFIHFAYEDNACRLISNTPLFKEFPNVTIIKSMSKDFGIAGIRAGYAIMAKEKIDQLLSNGYLWNVSGLAEYFFRLYIQKEFQARYESVRIRYIQETKAFFDLLKTIPGIRVFPSQANFFLIELLEGLQAHDFTLDLLLEHGIYVRSCDDKIGLNGQFMRIASRTHHENVAIVHALKHVIQSYKDIIHGH